MYNPLKEDMPVGARSLDKEATRDQLHKDYAEAKRP